jgi:hypothetical protein
MEYCSHCRAPRPTRKSSRKRTVRQPDGSVKTMVVDSFHCQRCNAFIGSVERDAAPAAVRAAAGEAAAAPEETTPAAAEDVVEAGAATDER